MPTLTAGNSTTFTAYDGGTVSIASNAGFASVSITQVAGPAISESWGPGPFRKVFGPFKEGATVTVRSQSAEVNYDGAPIPADTSSLVSGASNRGALARFRHYASAKNEVTGTFAVGMTFEAPGEFDGVRVVVHGNTNNANTIKASVAAPAAMGANNALLDSVGAALAPTAVTWGAASFDDVRVVGGAATCVMSGVVGSGATLREGDVVSDYISLRSLARTDIPGRAPLFDLKLYGVNPPMVGINESDPTDANPWSTAIPGFTSGCWASDVTGSATPGAYAFRDWVPSCSVIFYRRGAAGVSIHHADDSLGQGWIAATAVPQFGGNINGWMRKFVALLNSNGIPACLSNGAQAGSKSQPFHERAYNALLTGGITHLFVKPWSVNELGDGVASVAPALERTTQLLDLAKRKGVIATLIRPWAGQGITSAPGLLVQAYCDQAAANGVRVFDARTVIDPTGSGSIPAQFLTYTAGGAVVDTVHVNEAAHDAVAAAAYQQRQSFGIG